MQRKLFAVFAMTAVMMFAQGRGPGRPDGNPPDAATRVQFRVDRLAKLLTLTDAQKTAAVKIFTDADAAAANSRTAAQNSHEALATAIKANDINGIDRAATQIGTLHGQMMSIEAKASAAFYALLTAEQKAKYDQNAPGGRGMGGGMRGMGPGMPGMSPMGQGGRR